MPSTKQKETMDNKAVRHPAPLRDISNHEVIRPRDLPQVTGLSRTTCWRLSKDPESGFPSRIRLSAGAVGYKMADIKAWLDSRETVGGSHDN
jgi:prophage regulatory protein